MKKAKQAGFLDGRKRASAHPGGGNAATLHGSPESAKSKWEKGSADGRNYEL
jgi:hypothetical protein